MGYLRLGWFGSEFAGCWVWEGIQLNEGSQPVCVCVCHSTCALPTATRFPPEPPLIVRTVDQVNLNLPSMRGRFPVAEEGEARGERVKVGPRTHGADFAAGKEPRRWEGENRLFPTVDAVGPRRALQVGALDVSASSRPRCYYRLLHEPLRGRDTRTPAPLVWLNIVSF